MRPHAEVYGAYRQRRRLAGTAQHDLECGVGRRQQDVHAFLLGEASDRHDSRPRVPAEPGANGVLLGRARSRTEDLRIDSVRHDRDLAAKATKVRDLIADRRIQHDHGIGQSRDRSADRPERKHLSDQQRRRAVRHDPGMLGDDERFAGQPAIRARKRRVLEQHAVRVDDIRLAQRADGSRHRRREYHRPRNVVPLQAIPASLPDDA